jgi:predicted dehydrogenase
VADLNPKARDWFKCIPSVKLLTESYQELLASEEVDVVYVAVPHHLHEKIYCDVLAAGKDLLAEKPFGIDLPSAMRIQAAAEASGCFVRCSSEFPFMPGAQRAFEYVRGGNCGRILEVVSGFHHSSDLDPTKAVNWKRLSATCGAIGVMGDLGMHVCHLPLRLGWSPRSVYAQLVRGFAERPDGKGGMTACDTWDNAQLHAWVDPSGDGVSFPMRLEMKRLAPGETNSWFFEVQGTTGGVRYSTKNPKRLEIFERDATGEQFWKHADLGFGTPFKTVTGGIFETGFPDIMQQMLAAYLVEREGLLGERFGCVRIEEAVASQRIFAAALNSHHQQKVEHV